MERISLWTLSSKHQAGTAGYEGRQLYVRQEDAAGAVVEERARIRQELEKWLPVATRYLVDHPAGISGFFVPEQALRTALDRIIPIDQLSAAILVGVEAARAEGARTEGSRVRRELLAALEPEIRLHRIPGSRTEIECVMWRTILDTLEKVVSQQEPG